MDDSPAGYCKVFQLTVTGQAFLWHQVRCMAGILFLIGNRLEKMEVIDHMLDVDDCPRKPQYGMAADYPLILYDCAFEGLKWETDEYSHKKVVSHFQQLWTKKMMHSAVIDCVLRGLEVQPNDDSASVPPVDFIAPVVKADHKFGAAYKPLLKRPTSDTFEERYEHRQSNKKRRLEQSEETSDN
jgi:tRNA pseudouridine38/39 synthase